MVNPRMRKCQAPSCTAHATFKDVDAIHPAACATHKLDDMVHVSPRVRHGRLAGWRALVCVLCTAVTSMTVSKDRV